jgi:hypothetical protein
MTLKGKPPALTKKRLRALFYGPAGVGKTIAAIQFPYPYVIDTETGTEHNEYTGLILEKNGVVFDSSDYDEIMIEIKKLLTLKHPYKTLVIDPITIIYNELCDKFADMKSIGTAFQKHQNEATRLLRRMFRLLQKLDMNVIITAYSKYEYSPTMELLGLTFEGPKGLDNFVDLQLEIRKTTAIAPRKAFVKKTRFKKEFPDGDIFEFSYDEVARRYDKNILEKETKPIILASTDNVKELTRLIDGMNIQKSITEKWLKKYDCESFDEMEDEVVCKIISHLNEKLAGAAA